MFQKYYAKSYDFLNKNKSYKQEIDFVYKWGGNPSTILDIGAGTGAYWKYWFDRAEVWGIEKSKDMIDNSNYKGRLFCLDAENIREVDFLDIEFDMATSLFNVINYMPKHHWWSKIPIKSGGYFIFDIYDKDKIDKEGFKQTFRRIENISRKITPLEYNGRSVQLKIDLFTNGELHQESHTLYLHSHSDIVKFCGKGFSIEEVKETNTWQKWYKIRKK